MGLAATWRSRLGELHPRRFFLETWRRLDEEAQAHRAAHPGFDWRPLLAFCTGAVMLTLMEYFGGGRTLRSVLSALPGPGHHPDALAAARASGFGDLLNYVWWAGWRVLGYFLVPALVVRLSGQRLRDQLLGWGRTREHLWIYLLCLAVVLPLVAAVSFTEDFSSYYPFYKLARRSWFDFLAWELLYAAQFFSLEFFFRGWWLRAASPTMGSGAIFAMVVPYCMIHFGKPWVEALAAIVAGLVLGTLALKTRSIWSGFFVHVTVAVTMDVAALLQTVGLPSRWWPPL